MNQVQYPTLDLTAVGGNLDAIEQLLTSIGDPSNLLPLVGVLRAGYDAMLASPINTRGLSQLGGIPVIVVSYANAGKVKEQGVEIGFGYGVTPEFRIDGSYTFFDFEVENQATGDALLPNTAKHKGAIALTYTGLQGFDAALNARLVDSYDWAAGVFSGTVPSSQFIDLMVGYRVNNSLRVFANTTNLLDQKRFQLYGGSVIGRRILAGATATF